MSSKLRSRKSSYEEKDLSQKDIEKISFECKHTDYYESETGSLVCSECLEILNFLDFGADGKCAPSDYERCHFSKTNTKGNIHDIFSTSSKYSTSTINETQKLYKLVVTDEEGKYKIIRGRGRKALVAACLLNVLWKKVSEGRGSPLGGTVVTTKEIASEFNIKEKDVSSACALLKSKNLHYQKCFKVSNLTTGVCNKIGLTEETEEGVKHITKIKKLTDALQNTDIELQRGGILSVAAGIVYLYLCLKENAGLKEILSITRKTFSYAVGLSEITISKLARSASKHINREVEI